MGCPDYSSINQSHISMSGKNPISPPGHRRAGKTWSYRAAASKENCSSPPPPPPPPPPCPPPILPLTPLSLPLVHPPPLQQPLPQLHPSSNISSFSLEPPSHHRLHVSGHQGSREQLLKSNRSPALPGLPPPPPSANPHSSQLSSHLVLRLSSISNCPPPTAPLPHRPSSQPVWSCHLLAPPRPSN